MKITPIVEQFNHPIYPVLIEDVPQGTKKISEVIIYTETYMNGTIDYGKLDGIIKRWPQVNQNTLKVRIQNAIQDAKKM